MLSAVESGMRSRAASSRNAGKWRNSSRRPFRTASARSPEKSQKKREGRGRLPFLAHEQHGDLREQQVDGRHGREGRGGRERVQPVAEGAVADLVVVLHEAHEGGRRQFPRGLAARTTPEGHDFALEREALRQGTAELVGVAHVVGVIGIALARGRHVQHVMDVVVPLRRVALGLAPVRPQEPARGILLVLEDEVERPVQRGVAGPDGEFVEDVGLGLVDDGVDRVEPQPVEVELLDPVERVVDGEVTHRPAVRAVVVHRSAPGRVVPLREEARRVERQVVPVRPEVVVDDIEDDRDSPEMGRLDEGLHVLGAAVGLVRSVGQHPVVAPVPTPGKSPTGMTSMALTPRSTRWSSRSMAARNVPPGVKLPTCSS